MAKKRVGVDVGGTFTDVVLIDEDTMEVKVTKVPSTPESPEKGVLEGIERILKETESSADGIGFLAHGTTVATNAVLEGNYPETALVTTEGFRDILEIGRQDRPELYKLNAEKPEPVISRDRRYGVPERLDSKGDVVRELDTGRVKELADMIRGTDVDSVAVCYLFSYENPRHEEETREILRREGLDCCFSLSSEIHPEIKEFERTQTTAINAALKPVMESYLNNLRTGIRGLGVDVDLKVMQSNGGTVPAKNAAEKPVKTLVSGPAAGVLGASFVGELLDQPNVVTLDMGGTSTDISLVSDGRAEKSTETTVAGHVVSVPMVDVHTIGAGGGSVAYRDEGDALRVGPESAGAEPGPVCYGRGGEKPTVTDAHAVLGRIDPGGFIEASASPEKVREAISDLGEDGDAVEAASGLLRVAKANMVRGLRVVSVERGRDPRNFSLVAFGGAGPLHATSLASELGMPEVIVPRTAGVLSALGMLSTDVVHGYSVSRVRSLDDLSPGYVNSVFKDLVEEAVEEIRYDDVLLEGWMELRYEGQSFSLRVPVRDVTDVDLEAVEEDFHGKHEVEYGTMYPDEDVELVTLRLTAVKELEPPSLRYRPRADPTVSLDSRALKERREVFFDSGFVDTEIFGRKDLVDGDVLEGPAVVEGEVSTMVLRPGDRCEVDEYGNLVVEV